MKKNTINPLNILFMWLVQKVPLNLYMAIKGYSCYDVNYTINE